MLNVVNHVYPVGGTPEGIGNNVTVYILVLVGSYYQVSIYWL